MFSQYKMYIYAVLGIGLLFGLIASHLFMYNAGKDKILADQAELLKEKDRRIVKLQAELEDEQQKVKVIYRDRIKTIRETVDPSGCADAPAPDSILQQLER